MYLKTKIPILLGIFSVVPSIVIIFLISPYLESNIAEHEIVDLDGIATTQKNRINDLINSEFDKIHVIFSSPNMLASLRSYMANSDAESKHNIEQNFNKTLSLFQDYLDITILDTRGKPIISSNPDLMTQDYLASSTITQRKIGDYLTINQTRNMSPIIYISTPLISNKDLLGVVMVREKFSKLNTIISDYSGLGQTGEILLGNRQDNGDISIIIPTRSGYSGILKIPENGIVLPMVHATLKEENNFTDIMDYRGVDVLAVTRYIDKADLGLVVKIDRAEALGIVGNIKDTFIIITTIVGAFSILVALFLSRSITRPISKLKYATGRVSRGELDLKIKSNSSDEINDLADSFNTMMTSLKQAQLKLDKNRSLMETHLEDLELSNRELEKNQVTMKAYLKEISEIKAALDESSSIDVTDRDGTILDVNQKFCDITKYTKEELIGKNIRILKSNYHSPEFYQEVWDTIMSGKVWRGDMHNISKDGTVYWVRTAILPVLDDLMRPFQFIAVRTDITNQKKREEDLRMALDELRKIETLKDEFVSMISHELKSPLIPIMGYCEMLLDPAISGNIEKSQTEDIKVIYKNSKRLRKMIDDILTVQKLEMHKIKFEKKEIQTIPFMKNILESYTQIMKEKMIGFTDATSENHLFKSDPERLEQVFANLIQNSIDFVPYNGMIEIKAQGNEDTINFFVRDNGTGIPKETQNRLFMKFYQADTSIKRKHGGTGLGLSICKEIVEGLGGKIWVESEEGSGTTFHFSIPKE